MVYDLIGFQSLGLSTLLGGGVLGAVITLAVSRYGVAKPRPSHRGEGGAKDGCADRSSILRRRRRRTQEDVPIEFMPKTKQDKTRHSMFFNLCDKELFSILTGREMASHTIYKRDANVIQ